MTAVEQPLLQALMSAHAIMASALAPTVRLGSILAAGADAPEAERTWLGWSVGFIPAVIVIGAAYLVLRHIRSKH